MRCVYAVCVCVCVCAYSVYAFVLMTIHYLLLSSGKWLEEVVPTVPPRLFQCSNASGRFNVEEIFDFAQAVSSHDSTSLSMFYAIMHSATEVDPGGLLGFVLCTMHRGPRACARAQSKRSWMMEPPFQNPRSATIPCEKGSFGWL